MLFPFRPRSKNKKCVDHEKIALCDPVVFERLSYVSALFFIFPFVREFGFLIFYKKDAKTRLIYCIVVTYAKVNIERSFTHGKIYIFCRDFSRIQTQENYSIVLYPMQL